MVRAGVAARQWPDAAAVAARAREADGRAGTAGGSSEYPKEKTLDNNPFAFGNIGRNGATAAAAAGANGNAAEGTAANGKEAEGTAANGTEAEGEASNGETAGAGGSAQPSKRQRRGK